MANDLEKSNSWTCGIESHLQPDRHDGDPVNWSSAASSLLTPAVAGMLSDRLPAYGRVSPLPCDMQWNQTIDVESCSATDGEAQQIRSVPRVKRMHVDDMVAQARAAPPARRAVTRLSRET